MAETTSRKVFVAVIGTGGVGRCFVNQLTSLADRLAHATSPTTLSLLLVARSSKATYNPSYKPIPFSEWESALAASSDPVPPFDALTSYLKGAPSPVVLVDNTSSQDWAAQYPHFLNSGISVVTPNKKAFSSDLNLWNAIFDAAANGRGPRGSGFVFHESSVGAGLPVLSTLHDLLDTGDTVSRIEGVFSGTMSFLFNSWNPVDDSAGPPPAFSVAVREARDRGFTEPDPRDDLNGLDVARKLTILARIAGLSVESATSFPTQSLIPKELETAASAGEFLDGLVKFDGEMEKLRDEATAEGKVVRFVGSIDVSAKSVRVGLEKFDKNHPIAALKGSDNIISISTTRYGPNPLIIQGAGAGGEVTAMGVTGDLIKVLKLLN